jgi:hypothetical protein
VQVQYERRYGSHLLTLPPQAVAGMIGLFLHDRGRGQVGTLQLALLIYAESAAVISILLALNWLFYLTHDLQHFLADFCVSTLWFIAFGLFIKYMGATSCATKPFDWSGIISGGLCNQFKTCEAFSFLAGSIWIVDAFRGDQRLLHRLLRMVRL